MSPRRKIDTDEVDIFDIPAPKPPRRWGLPIFSSIAALLIVAAITASSWLLASHSLHENAQAKDKLVRSCVADFMTLFTTKNPFHANDYADRILSLGTGDFAKFFKEKMNEIVIQVAKGEPTKGTVLEAGVRRWDDKSNAELLVATKVSTTAPDGKTPVESVSRWVVTAKPEGRQCKISSLNQVM